jgi:hypothetical protein
MEELSIDEQPQETTTTTLHCVPCHVQKRSGGPPVALDFIIRNERAVPTGAYNAYISAFCRESEWLQELRNLVEIDPNIRRLMNHKSLKKELTECFGSLCLVERALRRIITGSIEEINLHRNHDSDNGIETENFLSFAAIRYFSNRLVFYDICSGKGITAFLLAFMFPQIPKIVMVDNNSKIKLDHLSISRCQNVEYQHFDVFTHTFKDYISTEASMCRDDGRIPVVLGLHLCGALSTRLVTLYNAIEELPVLVLSPCCLPKKSKTPQSTSASADGFEKSYITRDQLKRNGWLPYGFWCLTVYMQIDPNLAVKDMVHDELVESDKSTYIWTVKKTAIGTL